MARRGREDKPGSWHHVINRGIAKRPLFETRGDARFFLARLVRQVRLGRVEVHSFCLLTTHFHLLLFSPIGALSEAMRRVQNEYSRHFNRKRKRDGALIRGRFFSKPVRSLEYRRTLVRYIDANPIHAGLATSPGEYPLCSARSYLLNSGPRWLSRGWVESEACALTEQDRYTPHAYRAAFGVRDDQEGRYLREFIDARLQSRASCDPVEDLIGTAPEQVQAWMQRKASLADGHRIGLPVCGRQALRRALLDDLRQYGPWLAQDAARTWSGSELAEIGLLHDLCGCSQGEIVQQAGSCLSRTRRFRATHKRLLSSNPDYAERVSRIAHAAITTCLR